MDLSNFYSHKKRLSYHPSSTVTLKRTGLKKYFAYDDRFSTVTEEIVSLVKKSDTRSLKVLDVGVGDAIYERLLPDNIFKKIEFYGIDISVKQLKRSGKYLKQLKAVDLNKESIPYKNNVFNVVIISEVLEHVFFPEKVIAEAVRVLKKPGYLLITYPNSGALQLRLSLLFTGRSPLLNYPQNLEHIRFFSKEDILSMIESDLELFKYQGLSSLLFDTWNFPITFKLFMPRFLQVFCNKFFPSFALGNLMVFKKWN